jgi:hypothetical protein
MRKIWTLPLAAVAVLTASSAAFACDEWDGDSGRRSYRYSYGPVGYSGYSSSYYDDGDYYAYGPTVYAGFGFYDGHRGHRGAWRGGMHHAGGGGGGRHHR